ncbi:hypothetical protein THUN1379_24460 [Paludibacterium sp. THUN1379]|uniref:hypothetical protein n=1 Tax=Paludibacterium sp. THUN1379 TaxID=3112107 RepID=UPI00308BAD52|nr:hypothetical protein THUN1379_24460 [Paludibacterium sp. THUN1379]
MAITLTKTQEAFELLFGSLCDQSFSKSLQLEYWGERNLLPLVRTFLLGYFGKSIEPEAQATLPGALTGKGRLDFIIDNVAVEFAVRTPGCSSYKLGCITNESEIKKLLKYDGKSILVLFDFSNNPLKSEELEIFRDLPSLGQGNHKKSPFQLSYFFKKDNGEVGHIKKQIRVN